MRPNSLRRYRSRSSSSSPRGPKSAWPPSVAMTVRRPPSMTTMASPSPVPAAMTARLPLRSAPGWSDTSSSSPSAQMPCAVASRSFSNRTRGAGIAAASRRSSTTQGRLGVTARPSTTGPAMPTHAAVMSPRGPAARKRSTMASSESNSRLGTVASRTSTGARPPGSNSASIVLVPPASPARITLLLCPRVDAHDRREELERLGLLPLERVAPDDRAEAAAVADGAHLVEDRLVLVGGAAREDHDAPAVEGGLDYVAHALGQRADRHLRRLVDLLGRRLLQLRRGQLHLDDVGAELRGDVRSVRGDVEGRLAVLAEPGAARVRPDDDGEPVGLRLDGHVADLLVHLQPVLRAGIDREADGHAAQAQRVLDRARDRLIRVLLLEQHVVVVGLENERHAARELTRAGLDEAERRRVGVAAGRDGQLEVVTRIVRVRVHGEAAGRAVLDALVHRQDHEPAGAGERARVQQARQVRQRAGIVAAVPGQDLSHSFAHDVRPPNGAARGRRSSAISIPRGPGRPAATSLAALLDGLGDEPRPARLVAGADAGALVAVKILVEEEKVAPVRIDLERPGGTVHGAPAVAAAQEQADEPARQLARDVPEVEQAVRPGRAFDLEVVAVEVVELLQRLDQQVVHREPHGAAPVRVAPEERRARFRGLVVHAMLHAVHRQRVRMLAMIARERADPVG